MRGKNHRKTSEKAKKASRKRIVEILEHPVCKEPTKILPDLITEPAWDLLGELNSIGRELLELRLREIGIKVTYDESWLIAELLKIDFRLKVESELSFDGIEKLPKEQLDYLVKRVRSGEFEEEKM